MMNVLNLPIVRRQFLKASMGLGSLFLPLAPILGQQATTVFTVAGTGEAGYEPEGADGLPATQTPINNPYGIVAGPDGALYFCEVDTGRIRRLDLQSGMLSTVAGSGEKVYAGDGGPALQAGFSAPHEIRFDREGNLFVVERDAHVVRKIAARTRLVSTLAGTGVQGYGGDDGAASQARLNQPHSIAFDSAGNLLICDIGNNRVRSVDMNSGVIRTVAGTGERAATPDRGALLESALLGPRSIDTDPAGNAYLVLREGNAVYRLDIQNNDLQRIAGTGERGYSGDGANALEATFSGPKGVAYSAVDHSLYIVDTENHAIRRLNLTTGIVDTVLGTGERGDGPDGDPLGCRLNRPHGVVVKDDILYVTDSESHRIRAISGLLI